MTDARLQAAVRISHVHFSPGGHTDDATCPACARSYAAIQALLTEEQADTTVLQAVLNAIKGTLDPHTQIADHPNVKFAQMQRLKLEQRAERAEAQLATLRAALEQLVNDAVSTRTIRGFGHTLGHNPSWLKAADVRALLTAPPVTREDEALCVCGHPADSHGSDGTGHCGASKNCRAGGCKQYRSRTSSLLTAPPQDPVK